MNTKDVQRRVGPLLNCRYQEIQLKIVACGLKLEGLEDLLGEKIWEKISQVEGKALAKTIGVEKSMGNSGNS